MISLRQSHRILLAVAFTTSVTGAWAQDVTRQAGSDPVQLLPEAEQPGLPAESGAVDDKPPTFLNKDWQDPAGPPETRAGEDLDCEEASTGDGRAVRCTPVDKRA